MAMDGGRGVIDWINSFGLDYEAIEDLQDGVALAKVLCALAPGFVQIDAVNLDVGDNWVLAQSNLRFVVRNLECYFHDVLGKDTNFASFDVSSMAKGKNPEGLLRVAELLLALAVLCEDKGQNIGAIMALSHESQVSIQQSIEETCQSLTEWDGNADENSNSSSSDAAVLELRGRLTESETNVARLKQELLILSEEKRSLMAEKNMLQASVAEAQGATRLRSAQGDHSKQLEKALEVANASVEEQQQQLEELKAEVGQAFAKRDQEVALRAKVEADLRQVAEDLDIAQDKAGKLYKAEAALERYKQRIEELETVRDHAKELEEQSSQYLEQIMNLESEVQKIPTLKKKIEQYKDEKVDLERRCFHATSGLSIKEDEVGRLKEQLAKALEAKKYFEDLLISEREIHERTQHPDSRNLQSGGGLFESSAALTEKAARLQKENDLLKARVSGDGSGDHSGEIALLRDQLEDAIRIKDERAQDALAAERSEAEMEMELHKLKDRILELEQSATHNGIAHAPVSSSIGMSVEVQLEIDALKAAKESAEERAQRTDLTLQQMVDVAKARETEANAVQSEKTKLEEYMKRTIKKYRSERKEIEAQIVAKDEMISVLKEKFESTSVNYKRENQLMMSCIYEMGHERLRQNPVFQRGPHVQKDKETPSTKSPTIE